MKKFLLTICFLFCLSLPAVAADQTITFAWDASTGPVTGYNIYSADSNSGPWSKLNAEVITGIEYVYTYTDQVEQQKWFYVVATDGRNESLPSNIVDCKVDTVPPGKVMTFELHSD